MKTFRLIALAAALGSMAACKDSTGSDNNGNNGSLSFNYSGARSGSYQASGQYQSSGTSFAKQSFAVGTNTVLFGTPVALIASYQPTTSSRGDEVILVLEGNAHTGTYSRDFDCDANCAIGFVSYGIDPALDDDTSSDDFSFADGTVTVTSVSNGRMRGTFSGHMEDDETSLRTVNVVSGSFDVPMVSSGSLGFNKMSAVRLHLNRLQ